MGKPKDQPVASAEKHSSEESAAAQAMNMAKAVMTKENLEKAQQKAAEFYQTAKPVILNLIPHILLAVEYVRRAWVIVSPFLTSEVSEVIYYVILLFFGGRFAVTIACYQAFKICGVRFLFSTCVKFTIFQIFL